jgi:hypothetical protein
MTTTIASGVGGFFGIKTEATYGTFVAPDHFYVANSESLGLNKTTAQGSGFANGQLLDSGGRRVVTMSDASGTVALDAVSNQIGLLLKHLMGSGTSTVIAGSAFTEVFTLADTLGLYFSGQVGIPDLATGTLHPYSFQGGKVTGLEFSCDQGGILGMSVDMDFQALSESQTLAVPSYVATQPFHFAQESVKIGAFGSEAAIQGITKIDVKYARKLDTTRFYGNNLGLKSEPVTNGKVGISGTLSADYVTKADLFDKYPADTPFSLVIAFTSTVLISGTSFPTLTLTLPNCYLDSGSPTIAGLDVISGDLNFTCLYDGSHLPTITLITSDAVI